MKRFHAMIAFVALLVLGLFVPTSASAAPIFETTGGHGGPASVGAAPASGESAPDDGALGTPKGGSGEPDGGAPIQSGKPTPRIMVENFTTTPKPVVAGSDFDIAFTARNMSATTTVQNIKFALSGEGGLLPRSGSASVFVGKLGPRQSVEVTMFYTSLPGLEDKPYPLTLTIDYEDAEFTAFTSTETVAVMISQPTRVETSVPQVMPEYLSLGDEGSLVFTVNNLGKSAISNVKVAIKEGQGISARETYVGNVAAGQTANVDMIIRAEDYVSEPVKLTLTYENSEGEAATIEREVSVSVVDPEPMGDGLMPVELQEEESTPWGLIGIIAAVVLALVIIGVVVVRNRRKKKESADEVDALKYLDSLDGSI